MSVVAVILAGGSGKRMGTDLPKQYLQVGDRMVLEHTLARFDHHPGVDELAVVLHDDYRPLLQDAVDRHPCTKPLRMLRGGSERYLSVLSAVQAYADRPDDILLLHDAARPLVEAGTISSVLQAMATHDAAVVVVPTVDTPLLSNADGSLMEQPLQRSRVYLAQTPQAFRQQVVARAYTKALAAGPIDSTDDAGLVARHLPHVAIAIVPGKPTNIKITYPDDLLRLEHALGLQATS